LLNIDNKISPLPIWRYLSKPLCCSTLVKLQQTTFDSGKILHQQCNQNAKFQLNLPKQIEVTVAFVRSTKAAVGLNVVSFDRFSSNL